ncbi:MAG TPA: riboflavin biosynthesis protein RibF [Candidatus Saccharimonadales bacterium]|jgi:riboflavin kinase/FMN adenylyltransferase|nr:riboflavin biosynthesis protein RibF [Candidatus Saccharimonadales bacterium]
MRIFRALDEVPGDLGPAIVTVGNFDGVHCGHRHVLKQVVERARESGRRALAVSFDPHPLRILRPDVAPKMITPQPLKEALLAQTGIDGLLVIPFTRDFSMISAEGFARDILAEKLGAQEVHEGENFHFGHQAQGTTSRLADFGRQFGFAVKAYPMMVMRREAVSSSTLRRLIVQGQMDRARHLLGRVFSITGTPASGRGYGHKYTVPTINLGRYDELAPGDGVYFTRTRVGDEVFNSLTNVGKRPTFGDEQFAIETHLLDFHPLELTAQTEVEISFLRWRRPEIKFPTVEALKEQIGKDVGRAQRYFRLKARTWPRMNANKREF